MKLWKHALRTRIGNYILSLRNSLYSIRHINISWIYFSMILSYLFKQHKKANQFGFRIWLFLFFFISLGIWNYCEHLLKLDLFFNCSYVTQAWGIRYSVKKYLFLAQKFISRLELLFMHKTSFKKNICVWERERDRYIESTVGRRGRRSREPDMTRAYIPGPLWLDFRILESWPELKAHA